MKYSILQNRSHENDADKQKSILRRINILDIFLILLLVAVLFLVAAFFFDVSIFGIGGQERDITYTVEIDNVSADIAELIKKGDRVMDAGGKDLIGFVMNIKAEDCVRYLYNEDSKSIEKVTLPADENGNIPQTLRVTIQVTANYEKSLGYNVSGTRIAVGNNIDLCFAGFAGSGECVAVEALTAYGGGN